MERFSVDAGAPVRAALDALATRMGLGLLLIDSEGQARFCNRTALDLLGCRDDAGVSERWAALQSSRKSTGALPGMSESFTVDLALDGSIRFLRGESRITNGGHEVFLRDRRHLGAADVELLCASRMREWIHQCDALVHDANGALNTIQLTLELLDGQWPGPQAGEQVREPQRRNHVSVIRDNLDKLKGTLRQFVSAHDSSPAATDFDLRDVVRDAASLLRMPARRRRIELQTKIGDVPLRVRGNPARVRLALVNVALNRLEGLVDRSMLTLEAQSSAEGLELICRDDGELVDLVRSEIFRVFLAESGAGSAADALRLARVIVECEAGEFLVSNRADSGTTFRLLFRSTSD